MCTAVQHQASKVSKQQGTGRRFVVVEGFQLLGAAQGAALFDGIVNVEVPREVSWRRRLARARSMAHLPPGFSMPGEEERNYEVLDSYVLSDSDKDAVRGIARAASPSRTGGHARISKAEGEEEEGGRDDEGELAWLHLYFDEVVWTAAEVQKADVARFQQEALAHSVMRDTMGVANVKRRVFFLNIDGCDPLGKKSGLR